MFADMELIGIPHRIVVGERSLDEGKVEYRGRQESGNSFIPLEQITAHIKERIEIE
jgi:prolyl-tRNA synthetase